MLVLVLRRGGILRGIGPSSRLRYEQKVFNPSLANSASLCNELQKLCGDYRRMNLSCSGCWGIPRRGSIQPRYGNSQIAFDDVVEHAMGCWLEEEQRMGLQRNTWDLDLGSESWRNRIMLWNRSHTPQVLDGGIIRIGLGVCGIGGNCRQNNLNAMFRSPHIKLG